MAAASVPVVTSTDRHGMHELSHENSRSPVEQFPWLPCQLTLEVPIAHFTVSDLIKLSPGALLETSWHHAKNIPLRANGELVAFTEFEVVANKLAVRITDLA